MSKLTSEDLLDGIGRELSKIHDALTAGGMSEQPEPLEKIAMELETLNNILERLVTVLEEKP